MYLQSFQLKNKTALVTGAGKGIGKACAIALAEAGADLIIVSRTQKDLLSVQKTVKKLKRKCTSVVCDVSNHDEVINLFSQIKKLDVLINNAGTNIPPTAAIIGNKACLILESSPCKNSLLILCLKSCCLKSGDASIRIFSSVVFIKAEHLVL